MAISIETISGVKNQVGEGPVWDVSEKALYWLDPFVPEMYRPRSEEGSHQVVETGEANWLVRDP